MPDEGIPMTSAWPAAADGQDDTLRFSVAEGPDGVTVSLDGELDIVTLPDLGMALELATARGAPVTVDCASLRFADVAALRFLHRARDRARSAGRDLTLARPQPAIRRLLELTGSLPLTAERGIAGALIPVAHGPATVLRAAAAAAGQLACAPRANAQLADPAARRLRIVAQLGFAQPFLDFFDVVDDDAGSACGSALRSGTPVWVPDVARSAVFSRPAVEVMLGAGAAAVASVPVRAPGGEVIAVISAHRETPVTWQPMTKRHLVRLADVTGRLIGADGL